MEPSLVLSTTQLLGLGGAFLGGTLSLIAVLKYVESRSERVNARDIKKAHARLDECEEYARVLQTRVEQLTSGGIIFDKFCAEQRKDSAVKMQSLMSDMDNLKAGVSRIEKKLDDSFEAIGKLTQNIIDMARR